MFELTETIDIHELDGGSETVERVKGGFPRIKICDEEFIRKINERKPREFSKTDILPIKEILKTKKNDINNDKDLFNLIDSPSSIINTISGGVETNDRKINGVSISSIIGQS